MTKVLYDELPEPAETKLQEYITRKQKKLGISEIKILMRYQNYTEAEIQKLQAGPEPVRNWYRAQLEYTVGFEHRNHRVFFYSPLQKWQK